MSDYNDRVIAEFRASDGRIGGSYHNGELLLLHTIGAKSGLERINPLVTFEDGGKLILIASKGGAPSNPGWYYNLVANPRVEIEYGTEKFEAEATVISEPERTALFEKAGALYPFYNEYTKKTTRTIPVIALSRLN